MTNKNLNNMVEKIQKNNDTKAEEKAVNNNDVKLVEKIQKRPQPRNNQLKQPKPSGEKANAPKKQGEQTQKQNVLKGIVPQTNKGKLKIIPLGGINEIGKNITVFEYNNDILVVDCGMGFPDSEMPGVDIVIPDFSYLVKNKDRIKGLILTHGHEDHIGSIPYFLRDVKVPIYGTRMTIGLLTKKLEEHNLVKTTKLNTIKPKDKFKLGNFNIEALRVNHSIADAVSYSITTGAGTVIITGDFKIDQTPIQGEPIDLARFGELGKSGVLALMMDSTNAERSGYTMSEKTVGESFDNIFKGSQKRIIVATFASNVDRVQQIINSAVKFDRKVAVSGRSMENMVEVALELGYISVPKGTIIKIDLIDKYPSDKVVIITTGSQGEPMSALHRMAYSDHRKVEIGIGDLVIISASPIPGNEKGINKVINELYKKGVEVIHEALSEVHVSGHACAEELKMIMNLVRPKYFIPVHGEYRHLYHNKKLAESVGIDSKNILIPDIGKIIEVDDSACRFNGTVQSGRILVDGLGVGDVGNIVLRDRMHLAQDGLIVVVVTLEGGSGFVIAGPDIVSRGFVYMREAEDLMEQVKNRAKKVLETCEEQNITDWATMKNKVKQGVSEIIYEKTKRKPMILPVIMEI